MNEKHAGGKKMHFSGALTRWIVLRTTEYNKGDLFTLDDGRQIIGKIPNPIPGISNFTTAREVTTLSFVCTCWHHEDDMSSLPAVRERENTAFPLAISESEAMKIKKRYRSG